MGQLENGKNKLSELYGAVETKVNRAQRFILGYTTDQFEKLIETTQPSNKTDIPSSLEVSYETSDEVRATASTPESTSITNPGKEEGKSNETKKYYYKKSSKGLSGGAIVGIVLSCLAVVATVTVLIVITKKGALASKNPELASKELSNTSIRKLKVNNNDK